MSHDCRIVYSRLGPGEKGIRVAMAGTNVVFVGNLAWPTNEESLRQFASTIGPVLSVQIQTHADTGRSKGWGLVRYSSPDLAARAIAELNGRELDGRKLHVREDRTYIESAQGVVVFVGNLPWSVTTERLNELFAPYNPVDVHVKTNMAGRSRGFALVKFETADVAQLAIQNLNNYEMEGRAIQVRFDRQQQATGEGSAGGGAAVGMSDRVAVNNLAWSTDDHELASHMAQAGHVLGVEIQRHADTGKSKGWAIVTYATREEALQAINSLHKSVLRDRPIGLRFYSPGGRR